MGYWNTRGLRGSVFEEMINRTNEQYRQKKLAVIQKIPTPITPTEVDNKARTITQAYFEQKSTVDYIGAVQGIPVCFDAKETGRKSLPVQNIHPHQIEFMEAFEQQKGMAFLLVRFQFTDEVFYLPFRELKKFWTESENGGRKSIPYKDFDRELIVPNKEGFLTHYLEPLSIVLKREGGQV